MIKKIDSNGCSKCSCIENKVEVDTCSLPIIGNCTAFFKRYFYNNTASECQLFNGISFLIIKIALNF